MSEEEKKAIKMIKEQKEDVEHGIRAMECTPEDYEEDTYNDYVEWNKNANIILNLIEKQNNRLEQLEKENKEYEKIYKTYGVDDFVKEIKYLRKENAELKVLEDDIKDKRIAYVDTPEFEESYIPKSVIREKIEELEDNKSYLSKFNDWKEKDYTNEDIIRNCVEVLEEVLGEKK